MKNLLEFNEFKNYNEYNLITEADEGTSGKYFENVKGNMANADTTLIGSAVIKLFGFIKRKGMQAYLKMVLKPKLNRQYFIGVLRTVARYKLNLPPEASESKIIVKNLETKQDTQVTVKKDELEGMKALTNGATLTKDDGKLLEDGTYTAVLIDYSKFDVKDGIVSNYDGGVKEETVDTEEIDIEKEKQKTEELIKTTTEEIGNDPNITAEEDIVQYCNEIKNKYKDINDENKDEIYDAVAKIASEIQQITVLGLNELSRILANKSIHEDKRLELEHDEKIYKANIIQLYMVQAHLYGLIDKYNLTIKKESLNNNGDKLNELVSTPGAKQIIPKTSTNTPKVSDELKELDGKTVDFNDPTFYKQFDSKEVKNSVTNIILENKADIVKLQLQAERIIGDSTKMKNNWDRMVQDVLGKYSKFMFTDVVNPETLRKNEDAAAIEKYNRDYGLAVKKNGDLGKNAKDKEDLTKNKLFSDNTEDLKDFKLMNNGDKGIMNCTINSTNIHIIYEMDKITNDNRYIYRILGYIEQEDIENFKIETTDLTKYIKTEHDLYSKFYKDSKTKKNGKSLIGLYFISGIPKLSATGSTNNIMMMYLYSISDQKSFNETLTNNNNYFIKNKQGDMTSLINTDVSTNGKVYVSTLTVVSGFLYKIKELSVFIKDYKKINLKTITGTMVKKNIDAILPIAKK